MPHKRPYPPVEKLRQKLRYENGQLYWRNFHPARPDVDISKPVGNPISKKRPYLSLNWNEGGNRRRLLVHRVIWMIVKGYEPDTIDHINGVWYDNRIENLRDVSQVENLRAMPAWGKVRLKGVQRYGSRYKAMYARGGIFKWLGTFDTAEAAHQAWLTACEQLDRTP